MIRPARTFAVVAVLLCGAAGASAIASNPASQAAAAKCESRDLGAGLFFARGDIELPAPPESVFALLTDYENLPHVISTMDSARVVRRDSTGVVVRQSGTAALIVRRPVWIELRFVPTPPELLRFEIARGDFPVYYGSWKIKPAAPGSRLQYTLTMRPPKFIPQWIVRPYVERLLCRTLREVRAECERRAAR